MTIAVGVALFGAVFVLRLFEGGDPGAAITMLFVLPISLLALSFGLRGGVASGLFALLLVAAWVLLEGVHLSWIGWASRILPLLLLGGLLGHASDMLRRAEKARHALEVAALRQRDAIEINDTLVQGMAAARWSLEMGRLEAGLETLGDTLEQGHRMVSNLMRDAGMGLDGHRPPAGQGHDSQVTQRDGDTADR